MDEWQIGFVPHGWERGDLLQVRKAHPDFRGWVERSPAMLFGRGPLVAIDPRDVHCVAFQYGDGAKVSAWLEWWNDGCAPQQEQ